MVDSIERYWKETPTVFDDHYHRRGNPFGFGLRLFLRDRLTRIAPLLRVEPGDVAADVGCGSGILASVLRAKGARVVGVDFSALMLDRAKGARSAAGDAGLWFVQAEAADLPIAPGTVDVLVSVGLLDYVADARRVLHELCRVVRPGGRLVFTVPKAPSPFFFLRRGSGLWVRRAFFSLPPIRVALRRSSLMALLHDVGLTLDDLASIRHTAWIVQCRKP